MKKNKLAILVVGAFSMIGCSSGSDQTALPPVSSLQEGLNLFTKAGDPNLVGAYVKAGRAIYFETRRGAETLDVYQKLDDTAPKYEMDVRVLDGDGRLMYLQSGGDEYVDPTWAQEAAADRAKPRPDALKRADDFALMQEMSTKLQATAVPAALIHEQKALVTAQLSVRANMLRPAIEAAMTETGYSPGNNGFELHKKSILLGAGEHSATWTNINGAVYNSCNHGSCASTMGLSCTGGGGGGVDYHEYSQSNGSVNAPGCTTPYNWSSSGNHNCHDDSVRQMWGMQYGSQGGGTSGVCNNGAIHFYAPGCNTTSW